MFKILLILFLTIPIFEIYLIIKVGGMIGALPTIALLILTALVGAYVLRSQSFATIERVKQSLGRGEVPATGLLEGAILLVSGALLLTPGFFTDALGLLGLVPVVRRALAARLLKRFAVAAVGGVQQTYQSEARSSTRSTRVFEGDYRRDNDSL